MTFHGVLKQLDSFRIGLGILGYALLSKENQLHPIGFTDAIVRLLELYLGNV
jgi:hypothetical protein